MTSYDRFSSRIALRLAPWSRGLQAAVVAILLLGLPVSSGTARAATSDSHVFLVRGVLNIFSLGMDDIANKLRQQGINATVHNHLVWMSIANEAAAEYKSGRIKTIVLVGHSSGATCLPDIVARLDKLGVPVKLAIGLDSVFRTSLDGKVGRYLNFYVANGAGTKVAKGKGFKGDLENVDVESVPGVSHLTIDKNEIIQQQVISAIDSAVLGRNVTPAVRKPGATASGARPTTRAASATAN